MKAEPKLKQVVFLSRELLVLVWNFICTPWKYFWLIDTNCVVQTSDVWWWIMQCLIPTLMTFSHDMFTLGSTDGTFEYTDWFWYCSVQCMSVIRQQNYVQSIYNLGDILQASKGEQLLPFQSGRSNYICLLACCWQGLL